MEGFKLTLNCKNTQRTFAFPESYEELLTTIEKEFNINEFDEKKIKYLTLIDGDGDSYKIKNKPLFQSFKETIQNQQNTEIKGTFNYDGDSTVDTTQREEGSSVSMDEVKQVLETMLQPIKEEIKKLSQTVCEFKEMKGHLSEIASVKEDTQEIKRVSSNNKEEEQDIKNNQEEKVQHSDEHNQPSKGKINGEPTIIKELQHDVHVVVL